MDIGTVVNGKYRLVRLLGDGGMGSVYEARHTVLGTRVAIKVLHPELNRRTGLVERFLQEARVAAQIRSPNVVQVADVDRTAEGNAYIVMELLEGEPLSSVLDRQRRLPIPVACDYAAQILEALSAAHALGVIHRDLKPENVFVTFAAGRPLLKLIDFGIAKARRMDPGQKSLTVAGVVMGTAEYMAPEQAYSADKVDARSDLYAVGVMLYEMISGARPVTGDDARVIASKVERGELVPLVKVAPNTPPELAGLVHRAMAARAQLRFASATDMRLALEAAMSRKRSGGATPAPVPQAARSPAGATMELAGPRSDRGVSAHSQDARGTGEAQPSEPHVNTIRAPPLVTALQPSPYGQIGTPPAALAPAESHEAPRARRHGSTWVALVTLPLLIGAGAVALVVGTWSAGGSAFGGSGIAASPETSGASSAAPPAGDLATATAASGGAPLPTLSPSPARGGGAAVAAPPRGLGRGRPAQGTAPASPADASDPAVGFPTPVAGGFPPFPTALPSGLALPTAIPMPSGFPTSLPSALPSSLPPGFPTAFPGTLPPWPAPAPEPTASVGEDRMPPATP